MIKFGTKGGTLHMLRHQLISAKILPMVICTVDDWTSRKSSVIKEISNSLGIGPWIVRSSSSGEDRLDASNAGAFVSVLNVDRAKIREAIKKVIASYCNPIPTDEILIQPMLENVEVVGVAFSHDPNTGSPDRIINWSEGGDTQAITAGLCGNIWQIAGGLRAPERERLGPVVELLEELLSLFGEAPIDCEFAITKEEEKRTLWLLQVRPLILNTTPKPAEKHLDQLNIIRKKISSGMKSEPFLVGERTVYGIMPDWNPAEIIGIRPRPLAMSLYQDLITDSTWAYQRHNYGYRNLRSHPLMLDFLGLPYIDVRVSFNSFIPYDLDDNLASRLVDHYIDKLVAHPKLHDKVEFGIVFSCYTFDLQNSLSHLEPFGFSTNDQKCIANSLLKLTNGILHPIEGLWRKDADKLFILNSRRQILQSSNLGLIEKIYWLLEDCKRYGTLPFAGLARAAFIAVQMLKSLVNLNVLSEADYRSFMESVSTVSSEMTFEQKTMTKSEFLKKYGHLRPGTYDILSPRYDAKPELYFNWDEPIEKLIKQRKIFSLSQSQKKLIDTMLFSNGIQSDADNLFGFIRSAIEMREKAKFDFTQNLSEAMSLIERVGASNDLTLENLSFCHVGSFRELYVSAANDKDILNQSIAKGKANYKETLKLSLPPLITRPDDVLSFEWPQTDPNYITQKKVIALVATSVTKDEISNKIVFISNADPGFDWIFSYPISGFITAWGGANSHMAIRAGEQGIPAVIGAGEVLFRQWSSSKRLLLDCALRRVEIIQ